MDSLVLRDGRLFAHYTTWECVLDGYYLSCQQHLSQMAFRLLSNPAQFQQACELVVQRWPISSAVHLTNAGTNRRAWLGQSAAWLAVRSCRECTKEAWNVLPVQTQKRANQIAENTISAFTKSLFDRENCPPPNDQLVFPFYRQQ